MDKDNIKIRIEEIISDVIASSTKTLDGNDWISDLQRARESINDLIECEETFNGNRIIKEGLVLGDIDEYKRLLLMPDYIEITTHDGDVCLNIQETRDLKILLNNLIK